MGGDLSIELVTENDHVCEFVRDHISVAAVVPDPRFPKKVESGSLNHLGRCRELFGAKEHGGAEDAFESAQICDIPFHPCAYRMFPTFLTRCETGSFGSFAAPLSSREKSEQYGPGRT